MANQPPVQDLLSQVDFTANPSLDATELNLALSSLAGNVAGDGIAAIGFNLYTVDTAANTPNVPNPAGAGAGKWTKYAWIRVPFAGSLDKSVIIYAWNPDSINDAIFLHWVTSRPDLTALQTQVDNNTTDVASAVIVANQAGADASNALDLATSANTTATAANNTATAANNTANQAETDAQTAITDANNAQSAATTANNAASAAQTSAAAASATVSNLLSSNTIFGAWARFTVAGGVPTIQGEFNVASVTKQSTGLFRITFVKQFGNALTGMAILGTGQSQAGGGTNPVHVCSSAINPTTSVAYADIMTYVGNVLSDPPGEIYVGILGTTVS